MEREYSGRNDQRTGEVEVDGRPAYDHAPAVGDGRSIPKSEAWKLLAEILNERAAVFRKLAR